MATLAQARQAIATALAAATGGTVRERGVGPHAAKQGDGWVIAPRIRAANRFGSAYEVDLTAVIVAGADKDAADTYVDTVSLALIDAINASDLLVSGVAVEPAQLTDSGGPLFVLLVSCTIDLTE